MSIYVFYLVVVVIFYVSTKTKLATSNSKIPKLNLSTEPSLAAFIITYVMNALSSVE